MSGLDGKHKGCLGELMAACWLLELGYEVFRNVSPSGPVDVVAMKDGEILLVDIKSDHTNKEVPHRARLTAQQEALGVRKLVVSGKGIFWDESTAIPKKQTECPRCKKLFMQNRRHQIFCSNRCKTLHYYPPVRVNGHCRGVATPTGDL